jgi:NADPH:quinone reductase-like Zn-dependent oxidoreductase
MQQNVQALTTRGRLVFLATLGGVQAQIHLGLVMGKRLQIRGSTLRSRTLEEKLAVTRRFATQVLPLFVNSRIQPIVEEVLPLHEIGKAHHFMAENRNFGKYILRID